ncbi:hypothetical protein E4U42_001257 [Claviceps africana]|uniref:Uncharacterized protein n=1 Tax=Claviceps africana TaxID=83212 RepID=A0A8K0JC79_9HYPO|nr:hypothetical protein E4U42_001257 [Claviceps africana]
MENGSDQPNFRRTSDALQVLAQEVNLFPNIPTSRNLSRLDRVFDQLEALQREVTASRRYMEESSRRQMDVLERVEERLRTLETTTRAGQLNVPALVYNNQIKHDEVKLAPLHSYVTGQLAEGTSISFEELKNMPAPGVERLLRELSLSTEGNAQARKQRLRFNLGVQVSRAPQN